MLMHAGEIRVEDFAKLDYPVYASPKLNGIRGVIKGCKLESKSGIPLPNAHIWAKLSTRHLNGLEGEIICGDPTSKDVSNVTQSIVMSRDKIDMNFKFFVFDKWSDKENPFEERLRIITDDLSMKLPSNVFVLEQVLIYNPVELLEYEDKIVKMGYEGIVIKNPDCRYKSGRGVMRDQTCLKYKRFRDGEARIINIARSINVKDSVASIVVKDVKSDIIFSISSGLTHAMKRDMFTYPEAYMGKLLTYGYRDVSDKGTPKPAFFIRFRDERDMTKGDE